MQCPWRSPRPQYPAHLSIVCLQGAILYLETSFSFLKFVWAADQDLFVSSPLRSTPCGLAWLVSTLCSSQQSCRPYVSVVNDAFSSFLLWPYWEDDDLTSLHLEVYCAVPQ